MLQAVKPGLGSRKPGAFAGARTRYLHDRLLSRILEKEKKFEQSHGLQIGDEVLMAVRKLNWISR